MPSPVDKYYDQVKKDNPGYSDEQAWATAWSIYCKHKNPNSPHCHKSQGEYLKGQKSQKSADDEHAEMVGRVLARFTRSR